MSTLRETILDAVVAALAGTTGAGVHIYRSRVSAIQADAPLSVVVRPAAEEPTPIVVSFMDRLLDIEIEVRARGEIPDAAADDTVASVHSKIMADLTLGGACLHIEEGATDWSFGEADEALCLVTLRYRIRYRTADNSLTT